MFNQKSERKVDSFSRFDVLIDSLMGWCLDLLVCALVSGCHVWCSAGGDTVACGLWSASAALSDLFHVSTATTAVAPRSRDPHTRTRDAARPVSLVRPSFPNIFIYLLSMYELVVSLLLSILFIPTRAASTHAPLARGRTLSREHPDERSL